MTSWIIEKVLALGSVIELSILGKATIMLLLGLTAARMAKRTRASVRHLLLTATFAALIILPLMILAVPEVAIVVSLPQSVKPIETSSAIPPSSALQPSTSNRSASQTAVSEHWSGPSWITIIRLGWIAGAAILLLPLGIDLWRLSRIRRSGLPWLEMREIIQSMAAECGVRRSIEILLHEDVPAPFTCGVRRPAIMLPFDARGWSNADLRRALIHEIEHVRRGDWAIQLTARVICVFYWFHPLIWIAWRQLSLEAERACDDAVVQSAGRADYAEQLVMLARQLSKTQSHPALGMANRSDLSIRVSALLDGNQRRGRVGLLAAASALSGAGLLVLAIAPVRAVTQPRKSTAVTTQESSSQTRDAQKRRSSPLDRALLEAAESGETSNINGLLNAGANVNCVLNGDGTPLIAAARKGQFAAVQLLLDRGADPNLPVTGDGNPLIMAAREGYADVVSLLLDRGADIDQIVPEDENALIQASGAGRLPVVKRLVARGANVNARAWAEGSPNGEWRTPLSMARKGRRQAVVAFLLAAGARE